MAVAGLRREEEGEIEVRRGGVGGDGTARGARTRARDDDRNARARSDADVRGVRIETHR